MATNGTITLVEGCYFSWERTAVSLTNNTTIISWSVVLPPKPGFGSFDFEYTLQTLTINGVSYTGTSGTTTVAHNGFNAVPLTVYFAVRQHRDRIGTIPEWNRLVSQTETFTLTAIPVKLNLTDVWDFNDEENPTIYFTSSPEGNRISTTVSLSYTQRTSSTVDGAIAVETIPIVNRRAIIYPENGEFTITLTDEERANLRKAITSTSRVFTITLYSALENPINLQRETFTSSKTVTCELINYEPIINPTIRDTYAPTLELTGDNQKIVRYFSVLEFNTGAAPQKEATIDSQYIICGSTTLEDYTHRLGTIKNPDSNTLYCGMTDSRGFTVRDALVFELIPYIKLTSALTLQPLSLAGDLTIIFSGNCFNDSFGAQNNTLQFEYGIRENGGDITWHIIEPTVTYGDNTYEASYSISGLNPNSVYTITGNVIDALMSVQTQSESVTSTPIFDWGKNDFKHNTPVYLTKNLSLRVIDNDYNDVSVFNPCNASGSLVLGWGQYDKANGDTSIYGNSVNLVAKEQIRINGTPIGGKVLWQGEYYMNASQVAQLSAPISEQVNGIVLVFSLYDPEYNFSDDVSINTFFVSKKEVELLPDAPHSFFLLINSGFSVIGAKYLYINDTAITGHATNSTAGTNNNMTFSNNRFVLRYVIGV